MNKSTVLLVCVIFLSFCNYRAKSREAPMQLNATKYAFSPSSTPPASAPSIPRVIVRCWELRNGTTVCQAIVEVEGHNKTAATSSSGGRTSYGINYTAKSHWKFSVLVVGVTTILLVGEFFACGVPYSVNPTVEASVELMQLQEHVQSLESPANPNSSANQETVVYKIVDGGISKSGPLVKALTLGASTIMMGSFLEGSEVYKN